ncbi:MAG: acyltransferase family protein [Bacteriovoracaceae bacterium]|jgi:glucans biosynthesis protein C|nr:acyltransferase family protein [Bacteriovoracaceae bacterium]
MNISTKRIHAFDFLRSFAALWGIPFHAAIAYITSDPAPWLILDPTQGAQILDLMIWFSHRLRMPLFFLMSGYFVCMVLDKKGIKYFVKARIKKVFIPLVISCLIILPIIVELFMKKLVSGNFYNGNIEMPYKAQNFQLAQLAHLWFLYYLFLFSILTIPLRKINFFTKIQTFILENKTFSRFLILLSLFLLHLSMDSVLKINATSTLTINPLAFVFYF